jgi:DEAD/DEAH box helicase domain-containing protein
LSQQLVPTPNRPVPARAGGDAALLSVLKGLEIQKTLGSEPVLAALRHFPAEAARIVDFPEGLHPKLRETLEGRGYAGLYSHQREAFERVQEGKDVVVVTPTASGKTLCYNLPVLDRVLKDPDARALYLFPTKALAQDQLAELHAVIESIGADIGTFTYDGDTPQDARKSIRARARTWWSRTPTCSTRASCRTTPSG